ncbi:hypothetical protein ADUPG1_008389 [Aduncisulcus paluster]|uniref:LAGLIDADG homing endonuclease n=1 Tax=Aduncisulcus paluster TaxID=2918883 RepID=A0ABQ5KRT2_9EUKA|nr:hypothetical protein ADUPG1_008389 [Aduncisulcus paluster]
MELLGIRTRLGIKLRAGNDAKNFQHYAAIGLFDLHKHPPTRNHTFFFLYCGIDEVESENLLERIVLKYTFRFPSGTSRDDIEHFTFYDILYLAGLFDRYMYEARFAGSSDVPELLEYHKRFVAILSPLSVHCGVISDTPPIKKVKTHSMMHLQEWIDDGGPLRNYSAETGENKRYFI